MALDTGVNAALGASNYTPFLQGAMQGAQMQAQGAQNIGQGLANLGSSAGQTILNIGEQKKQNQQLEGSIKAVENFLTSSKQTAEMVSPGMGKNIDNVIQQMHDQNVPLSQRAAIAQQTQQHFGDVLNYGFKTKELIDQQNANAVANFLQQGNGQMPSPVNANQFTPTQLMQGRQLYLSNALNAAKTQNELSLASKNAQPIVHSPGETYVIGQEQSWLEKHPKSTRNDIPGALISQWSQEAQNAGRPIQTPEEQARSEELKGLANAKVATAKSELDAKDQALHSIGNLQSAIKILSSGTVDTGKLSTLKNNFYNYLTGLGVKLSPDQMNNIASTNELQSYLSSQIGDQMQGVRNIRNQREFDAVTGAIASMGKGNVANTALLKKALREQQYKLDLSNNAAKYISGKSSFDNYDSIKTSLTNDLIDSYNQSDNAAPVNVPANTNQVLSNTMLPSDLQAQVNAERARRKKSGQ
jgi:hypothetical protein